VQQVFWWVLDGHSLPFWILLGIVIYRGAIDRRLDRRKGDRVNVVILRGGDLG
jgi:hypothetical protein